MANKGLLIGMMCPKCKSEGPFDITCTTTAHVYDHTVDDHNGMEWGDDAEIRCSECGHDGRVRDFTAAHAPWRLGDRVVIDPSTRSLYAYDDGVITTIPLNADDSVDMREEAPGVVDFRRITPEAADHIRKIMHPLKFEYQQSGIGNKLTGQEAIEWNYDDTRDRLFITDDSDYCYCILRRNTEAGGYNILRASSPMVWLGAEGDCYAVKATDTLEEAVNYILEG